MSPTSTPTVAPSAPSASPSITPSLSPSTAFVITTVAGSSASGSYSGDNGAATTATLNYPHGVTVDSVGNIYIADRDNHRIRKVTVSTGIITTVAGTGSTTFSGDNGPASSAALYKPYSVTLDSAGNLYISDTHNQRIRKVTISTGIINTIAGTGAPGFVGDGGAATSATLFYPVGLAVDASGNVFIADDTNHRVRKVTVSTGILTTIAGTGTSSFSGDGGAATAATLYYPSGVMVDSLGNVYIVDQCNHRIRKVTVATGIISTVVGTGTGSYSGDNGPATSATLYNPTGATFDTLGNMYIADLSNQRIRKVTTSSGIITTVAGSSIQGYSGDDGPATAAGLFAPYSLAVDASGTHSLRFFPCVSTYFLLLTR